MAETKLIVGLGNPGPEYLETRHNIGFLAVDDFADGLGGHWKSLGELAEVFEPSHPVSAKLLKPLQYMNNSGGPVKQFMDYYHILPEEILVISDDFSLPLGTVRLRLSGSCGGHNGLASILNTLGTNNFPRLRLGIGLLPEKINAADFVLSKFKKSELGVVREMLEKAHEAIGNVLALGAEKAASKIKN